MTKENSGVAPVQTPIEPAAPASAPVDTSLQPLSQPTTNQPADNKQEPSVVPSEGQKPADQPASLLQKAADDIKKQQEIFGDDWRQKIAGEDAKLLKTLEKYKTPKDLADGYLNLQKEFHKTRPVPELPKDATKEQIAEYREKTGIPESWDKYDTNLADGIVIGENDKPIVDKYLQKAYEMNLKPAEVKQSLQAYFEITNQMQSEAIKQSELQQQEVVKGLQKEWGSQYKDNLNIVSAHLEKSLGADELSKLNSATLADGTFLINNPKILNHFLNQAKTEMGGNTITPSGTLDFVSLNERKAQLEKIANTDNRMWFNSPDMRKELADITATLNNKRG